MNNNNNFCPVCKGIADTSYASPFGEDESPLCGQCARIDIVSWLADCDRDEIKKLRRRAEDCLRKNPTLLREVLVVLIKTGAIEFLDCV